MELLKTQLDWRHLIQINAIFTYTHTYSNVFGIYRYTKIQQRLIAKSSWYGLCFSFFFLFFFLQAANCVSVTRLLFFFVVGTMCMFWQNKCTHVVYNKQYVFRFFTVKSSFYWRPTAGNMLKDQNSCNGYNEVSVISHFLVLVLNWQHWQ